jgi:hypothetical protein
VGQRVNVDYEVGAAGADDWATTRCAQMLKPRAAVVAGELVYASADELRKVTEDLLNG